MSRFAAEIDLDAISANVARLDAASGDAAVMAVVKADGYGHGIVPSARAAIAGGATWLGVAFAEEALALRAAGVDVPVLAWLLAESDDLEPLVRADVDVSVSAIWALDHAIAAAERAGRPAHVHLKVDTGLGRAGATRADWPDLVTAAAKAVADGTVEVTGIWSHLAYADAPTHPTIAAQVAAYDEALDVADRAGVRPRVRHLANSAATLALPATHYDVVRPGIAVYGLSPGPAVGATADLGLRPAMTLRAEVALVKRVPAGQGVSYAHRYTTQRETTLALVPLGYADGVPRHATNVGPLSIAGRRYQISGTVCMDQFVVDVGDDAVEVGDAAVLFGPGDDGEPTADDWAAAVGTINYEIVTRIGSRVPRTYVGGAS
ncbi:MAG: alanine racemase [Frankiaceae bacterium]|nr:alanine racemase [Frankiaceae bacterium]MBV9369510.1 alanine racemase [Frankiales bacterium]